MNTAQANDLAAIHRALFSGQKSQAKFEAQEAFLRIAKFVTDVAMLDEWSKDPMAQYWRCWETRFGFSCDLVAADGPQTTHAFAALEPEQARAKAVESLGVSK